MNKPWYQYHPEKDFLVERVILVTGAGHGLGRMAAYNYARFGATVLLLDYDQKALDALYDQILARQFPEPVMICHDLRDFTIADASHIADQISQQLGRLDGLLHNAGILGMLSPLEHMDPKLWHQTLQVNLNAAFLLLNILLPLLKQAPDAAILLTSTARKRYSRAYWNAYAVAGAGIDTLCTVVADELSSLDGLRVNSLDPGDVNTRLFRQAFPGRSLEDVPTTDSLALAYLYLMGPDSSHIRGRKLSLQSDS